MVCRRSCNGRRRSFHGPPLELQWSPPELQWSTARAAMVYRSSCNGRRWSCNGRRRAAMVCHRSCKHAPWELQKCFPVLQAHRREPPRCCKLAVESRRGASRPPMSTPPSCYKSAVELCGGVASPSTMAPPPCCKPVVGAPPAVVQVLMLQRWVADQRVPRVRARRCGGRRVLPCLFIFLSFLCGERAGAGPEDTCHVGESEVPGKISSGGSSALPKQKTQHQ